MTSIKAAKLGMSAMDLNMSVSVRSLLAELAYNAWLVITIQKGPL
jgi:hypothetical protein